MPATPRFSRRFMLGLPLGLVAVGTGIGVMGVRSHENVLRLSGQAMGTTYSIIAVDPQGLVAEVPLQALVDRALAAADATLSNWNMGSELAQVNALAAGETFVPSTDLRDVLKSSLEIHSATDGRFDVAMGDLINLWGFGTTGGRRDRPSAYEVDALLAQARTPAFELDASGTLIRGASESTLFVPSIGKGAGVDIIAKSLRDLGLENFMVEIGGDLITAGLNPDGEKWQIGIERPDASTRQVEQILGISGFAMATAGDYRNYFEVDGQRYSHIIDPSNGTPITHTTASVTVFTDSAMEADAWSTGLLVMGLQEGLALANAQSIPALFIERGAAGYELHGSAAFQTLKG